MTTVVPQGYRRIGEGQRFRELVGRGLAEFTVGEVIEHRPARTVTETEHVLSLALMGNPAPVHSDVVFCERTGQEMPLVCGLVTLMVVLGMTVRSTSGLTSGNLALDEVRFEHPVHTGDTLRAQTTVVAARRCTSRPEHDVVTCRIEGFNQPGREGISATSPVFRSPPESRQPDPGALPDSIHRDGRARTHRWVPTLTD